MQGKGIQTESGSLPELRQSLERSRWLEFMEQSTREESTTKREYSTDLQRVPLESSAEF